MFLEWNNDDALVNERFSKVKMFFTDVGQPLMEVGGYYDDLLNAIISSIYVLDLSTIHMATMRNIDPSLTPAIDLLKGYQKNEDVYPPTKLILFNFLYV